MGRARTRNEQHRNSHGRTRLVLQSVLLPAREVDVLDPAAWRVRPNGCANGAPSTQFWGRRHKQVTPMRSPSENMRCDGATPSTQILLECRNRKKSSPITPSASEIAHVGWRQRTQRGSGEPPCLPGRSRCCRATQCAGAVCGRSAESGAPSRAAVGGPTGQGSTADRRMDSLSKRARLRRVGRY